MAAWKKKTVIGDCVLYLGDCLEVMREIESVDHMWFDPPYEQSLHDAKNSAAKRMRTDGRQELKNLTFKA